MAASHCAVCGSPLSAPDAECETCRAFPKGGSTITPGLPSTHDASAATGSSDAIATIKGGETGSPSPNTINEAAPSTDGPPRSFIGAVTINEGTSGPTVPSPPSTGSGTRAVVTSRGRSGLLQSGLRSGPSDTQGDLFDNGRYELLKEIARGGMGAVYKARQRDLNRIVALKVMLSGALASDDEKKRFLREAEASGKLQHPNIVRVYDVGEVEGNLYFTMDFVEGAPLSEKKRELDRPRLLDIMIKVCDAVAYAHMRGIIHRDLKPGNVMMDAAGEPKIMDFGLAKETTAESDSGAPDLRTREGSIMGTPHYMPPEQAEGLVSEIDVRSDVYALGVILYELWTGQLPFNAKRVTDLMRMVLEQEPPPPRSIDPTIPWEIEAVTLKAMEKQKAKRYETALDMKRDLERFKNGDAILARKANLAYRARKWVRRHRFALAGALAVASASGFAGFLAWRAATKRDREALAVARTTVADARAKVDSIARTMATIPDRLSAVASDAASPTSARKKSLDALADEAGSVVAGLEAEKTAVDVSVKAAPSDRDLNEGRSAISDRVSELEQKLATWKGDIETNRRRVDDLGRAEGLLAAAKAKLETLPSEPQAALEELKRIESQCLAAVSLGAVKAGEELLKSAAPKKKAVEEAADELEAAGHAESAQDCLDKAARSPDATARFALVQDALEHVRKGLQVAPSNSPAASRCTEEAQAGELAFAEILVGIGAFDFAEIKAKAYAGKDKRADEILAEIRAKRADKGINADAMDRADAHLAGGRRDATFAARLAGGNGALAELARVRQGSLDENDRKRFEDLARRAKGQRVEALVEQARAPADLAKPEAAVDAGFDEVRKELAQDPLPGVAPIDAALQRGTSDVLGAQGSYHLLLATRRSDASAAYDEAKRACELLDGREGWQSEYKAALDVLASARREKETPTGMILVPAVAGVSLGGDERNPRRTVQTGAFYIGRFEVTNEDFKPFVDARTKKTDARLWKDTAEIDDAFDKDGVYKGPRDWEDGSPPRGREKMPVAFVSFSEAEAFARWKGEGWRLPTDEEWEVAARVQLADERGAPLATPLVRELPWGPSWGNELAGPRTAARIGADGAHPADVSALGCHDMAGNVAEWVEPSADPSVPEREGCAPVRGGSFLAPVKELSTPRHRSLPQRSIRDESVGFRLAKDPPRGDSK
jgi:formylglycine-generating enzyme required for sulfatase activity/tRNA A-37 threonylcarbamoyl transferase component Bud32